MEKLSAHPALMPGKTRVTLDLFPVEVTKPCILVINRNKSANEGIAQKVTLDLLPLVAAIREDKLLTTDKKKKEDRLHYYRYDPESTTMAYYGAGKMSSSSTGATKKPKESDKEIPMYDFFKSETVDCFKTTTTTSNDADGGESVFHVNGLSSSTTSGKMNRNIRRNPILFAPNPHLVQERASPSRRYSQSQDIRNTKSKESCNSVMRSWVYVGGRFAAPSSSMHVDAAATSIEIVDKNMAKRKRGKLSIISAKGEGKPNSYTQSCLGETSSSSVSSPQVLSMERFPAIVNKYSMKIPAGSVVSAPAILAGDQKMKLISDLYLPAAKKARSPSSPPSQNSPVLSPPAGLLPVTASWLLRKKLTATDVNPHHNRIVLPTDFVKQHLMPAMGLEQWKEVESNDGKKITLQDCDAPSSSGDHWFQEEIVLKKLPSMKNYILRKKWYKGFVERRELKTGDEVGFCWDSQRNVMLFHVLHRATTTSA